MIYTTGFISMSTAWAKMMVEFNPDSFVKLEDIRDSMCKVYNIGFIGERYVDNKQMFYFQTIGNSRISIQTMNSICHSIGTVVYIRKYDKVEGTHVNTYGKFRPRGGNRRRLVNNGIICITPFEVGKEDLRHITLEDVMGIIEKYIPRDISTRSLNVLIEFARIIYLIPKNMNIKASSKDGTFKFFDNKGWRTKRMSPFFSDMVSEIWIHRFRDCIETHKDGIPDKVYGIVQDTLYSIECDSNDILEIEDFRRRMKRKGLVLMSNVSSHRQEEEIRLGKKIKIG